MKPTKKMILTQNLVFNAPFALIMVLVSTYIMQGWAGFNVTLIPMFFIALALIEFFGFIIPVQKIAGFFGAKVFKGKNPMAFPQFLLVAAVLTVIFTVLMTLSMTLIGMLLGGAPLSMYWASCLKVFPWLCLTAYCCVLVFLPLSMKVSGMDKFAGGPPQEQEQK